MRSLSSRLCVLVAVVSGFLFGFALPAVAVADAPPPLGSPTDHFRDRQPVGQEGLLRLTDGSQGDTLNLSQLDVIPDACQDPPTNTSCQPKLTNIGNFIPGNGEMPVTDGSFALATGFVEADLDVIAGSNPLRGALEPGLAISGAGATAPGCTANDFCTVWKRTTYDGSHHFAGFEPAVGVQMNDDAAANTEVAIVAGTFDPQVGPSLAVAWVSDSGGNLTLKVANVVPQRDGTGDVQGLQIAGQVQDLGAVRTDPAYGRTSPSLAVGDFSGDGTDQLAVAWAPGSSTLAAPRVSAAILGGGNGGGFEVENGPTAAAPSVNAVAQLSPDAVAIHDMSGKPIDRLLVAPGLNLGATAESSDLRRFTPAAGGALQTSRVPETGAPGGFRNSNLQSVGDLNGDGIDEMVSTLDARITPGGSGVAILRWSPNTGSYRWLSFSRPSPAGDGWTPRLDQPMQTTVLDARTTTSQRIAPRVGSKDWGAMPQIVVTYPSTLGGGFWRISRDFTTLDDQGEMSTRDSAPNSPTFFSLDPPAPPRLAPFPFNGQAELGEPVQGAYTQVEPSVILNSPPTHFDILDGQAYDPNFCYQGNQYMVPPVCFFNSEYERETDASTEVKSESTEDWSVSAKVTTDFSILDVVDVNAEIRGGYGEKFEKDNGTTTSANVDVTVKSLNSDKIYAIIRKYDTLEYPLYQPGSANPSGYVLAVTPHTISRRWIDSSSPSAADIRTNHQPGNILSYPNDVTKEENPFISTTSGVDSFAHDEFELSDSSDYKYALTTKRMTDDKTSTSKDWNVGATIGLGGKVAGVVDVKAEVSGDYKNGTLNSTTTTAGDTTKLTSTMAGIDESFGETAYVVKPFSYWTQSATLVVDYAVEPVVAPPGAPKTWWQRQYGSKPDLTLNLPRLLDYEEQSGISSDAARFISPGVSVLQGNCAAPGPLLDKYPSPGAPLCIQADVENYSLKDQTSPTKVRFYDADPDVGGQEIGAVDVGPVAARDSRTVELNWTPDARYAGTRPRIFVEVDSDDQVSEVHETNNKGYRDYQAMADAAIAPRAPSDVTADQAPGRSLDISWTDDLGPVQPAGHQWRVVAYPDDGGTPIEQTVPGGQNSATLTNLPTGRYRVAVFSVLGNTSSPASHPSEPADIVTDDPSKPTNVVGVARNASVQLSWDAPADTGGGPIDTYRIREYRAPGESFPEAPVETTVSGDVTALTLSGLTNGRAYRFTVQAVNERGPGANSDPSDAVTPRDVPDKPVNVKAAAGAGGKATVTWDPPASDAGRAPVTGYEITASPGGVVKTVAAGTETLDFDGLQRGTAYTFRIRANSEVGFGAESQPSASLTLADPPEAPKNLSAGPGSAAGSATFQWEPPDDDGGVPIASYEACLVGGACQRVGSGRTDVTFGGAATNTPLTFTVNARNQAGLDSPLATTTTPVVLDDKPTVNFTKVPAEGSYTTSSVEIGFDVSADADTDCYIDGQLRPCRSPIRLTGLTDGSHTIQVEARSSGGRASTSLVAWSVDGVPPTAKGRKLRKLVRASDPSFVYAGSDQGGSGLQGYEVRTRRAGKKGKFSLDPIGLDATGNSQSASQLKVAAGETVCASVRAVDGAGNRSEWSAERCTARPLDESALRREGKWKRVRDKSLSNGHALLAKRNGVALTTLLGKTSKVKVLASRCRSCGKLAVEVRGHRRKTIDLSKTKKHRSRVIAFNAKWPKKKDGRLRLISLGGGKVEVDGVAVWRTTP